MEYLPNRLTPFNFKIHYKEENYLEVKTASFKYITPPHSKGSVCRYIALTKYVAFLHFKRSARSEFYYMT